MLKPYVVLAVLLVAVVGCSSDKPADEGSATAPVDSASPDEAKRDAGWQPTPSAGGARATTKDSDAGSEPAADSGAASPKLEAFEKLAGAYCDKLTQCTSFGFERSYESGDACRTRRMALYKFWAELPDTGWTADSQKACFDAVYGLSCREFIDDNGQNACAPKGKRKDGEKCNAREQCTSRFCDAEGYGCGTCKTAPKEGASCREDNDCPDQNACLCDNGTPRCDEPRCRRLRDAEEACSPQVPCGAGLNCRAERCEVAPAAVGDECDPYAGVFCDTVSAGLVCTPEGCAKLTAAATCSPTAYCKDRNASCEIDPDSKAAACKAIPDDGEACDVVAGRNCRFPAICSKGKCQLPGAAALCK
jgi:hypothetical protein